MELQALIAGPDQRIAENLKRLGANKGIPVIDDEGRRAADAAAVRLVGHCRKPLQVAALIKGFSKLRRVEPRSLCRLSHDLPVADVAGLREIHIEDSFVVGLELFAVAGELA